MAQARGQPGVVGQTVTIPVSLRVESYPASQHVPVSHRDDELKEMRMTLLGVREELRQVKLTVAELVRVTYESVARLDSLMAPARLGAQLMEAMQSDPPQRGSNGPQRWRDAAQEAPRAQQTVSGRRSPAVAAPHRAAGGGNRARGQQISVATGRPAAFRPQKKKPIPNAELLSDLAAKQDGDPVVSLVKKAVSGGQEPTRQDRECLPKESQLLMRQWSRLELHNGVLYRRACLSNGSPPIRQLVTSSESVQKHIQAAHKRMGHCGTERLLEWARAQLFSPGLATQVENLIRQCEKCGAAQRGRPAASEKSPPSVSRASQAAGGHSEREESCGSPEVYALAPDQDPEQDPDTILFLQLKDSRGSSPCELLPSEGCEFSSIKEAPALNSADGAQEPLYQKGLQNSPAAAEPLAGECDERQLASAVPSPGSADLSLLNPNSHPAGHCRQQDSPGCDVTADEGAAVEA